jgi:hypothetical protein
MSPESRVNANIALQPRRLIVARAAVGGQAVSGLASANLTTTQRYMERTGPAKAGHYVQQENQAAWRNTGDEETVVR